MCCYWAKKILRIVVIGRRRFKDFCPWAIYILRNGVTDCCHWSKKIQGSLLLGEDDLRILVIGRRRFKKDCCHWAEKI